jgi:transmembrane sensor
MNNEKYIEKWLNGSLNEEEMRAFEKTEDYQSLAKLDRALLRFRAPQFDVEGELAELNKIKKTTGKIVQFPWIRPMLRVAAAITVVILGYFLLFNQANTVIETGIAEKTNISLPDNSVVVLNALTTLSFNKNHWQDKRHLVLDGEAYFKVAKGSVFDVETSAGTVAVLGTQFNVKVRENYFEVKCFEGLVAVINEKDTVKLMPSHMYRIINGRISSDIYFQAHGPSWINNESSFTSVPFEQVVKEFERQYNVSITINEVDLNERFTGRFTHEDISLALKSISIPLNLRYEFEEDQHIVLSGANK